MTVKVTNNAWGTLAVGVNDTDTTLLLGTAQGDRFPSLPTNNALKPVDCFYVTLIDEATNEEEIVRVIERNVDTLIVIRAQDGTRKKQFLAGSRVELRPIAALFNSKIDSLDHAASLEEIKKTIEENKNDAADAFDRAVHVDPQDLTDKEKKQARDNLDLPTFSGVSVDDDGIVLEEKSSGSSRYIKGSMAGRDWWRIEGRSVNGNGLVELATSTGGNESIAVRQYSGDFSKVVREAFLLREDGNSKFPGICYASSFQATSDRRLKFGFEEVAKESVLDAITPYRYGRLDKNPKERFVGVIAQDVQEVIPEAVREDGNGYLSVDYAALTAVLWGEVKRLKNEIQEIKDGMRKESLQTEQKGALQEAVQEVLEKPVAKPAPRKRNAK